MLSTISERGTSSPVRINSPRRIPISKRTYGTPAYTPRPININTADIDVSRDRYRHKIDSTPVVSPKTSPRKVSPKRESPKREIVDKENGPFMPRVDGKPETGIDSSPGPQRSTIKRGRTVVRLHTIKRRERDSPRKPAEDSENQGAENSSEINDADASKVCDTQTQGDNTENLTWREKLSDDLIYKGKKEKKSLGTKLVEKFIIKDDDVDVPSHNTTALKEISQSLPATPLPDVSNVGTHKSPDRRCSMELLAEQASLFDSLIRRENLSTTGIDLSKVGVSENSSDEVGALQPMKKRKGNDKDNPLKTTKSDHSLHNSLKYFRDHKDTRQFSKRRSLKKSSSGGTICRLDSITEFPKELSRSDLPSIEESRLSIKKENTKPKPKLKPIITSSVEVSPPKSPLKFKIENVTVEEIPRTPKKEIIYSSIVETPLENKVNTNIPQRTDKSRKSIKKKKNINIKNDEVISPEPEDGNFWDKIGKRETVYLIKRKQNIDEFREKSRRALFWYPECEDTSAGEESHKDKEMVDTTITEEGIENEYNQVTSEAHESLLNCDIYGSKDNQITKMIPEDTSEVANKLELNEFAEILETENFHSADLINKNKNIYDAPSELRQEKKQSDKLTTIQNPLIENKTNVQTESAKDNKTEDSFIIKNKNHVVSERDISMKIIPSEPVIKTDEKSNVDLVEKPMSKSKTNTNVLSLISQESTKDSKPILNENAKTDTKLGKMEENNISKPDSNTNNTLVDDKLKSPKGIPTKLSFTDKKSKTLVKPADTNEMPKCAQLKSGTNENTLTNNTSKTETALISKDDVEDESNVLKEALKKSDTKDDRSGPKKLSVLAKSVQMDEATKPSQSKVEQKKNEDDLSKNVIKIEILTGNDLTSEEKTFTDENTTKLLLENKIGEEVISGTNILPEKKLINDSATIKNDLNESKPNVEDIPDLENIPSNKNELKTEVLSQEEKLGENTKAENIPKIEEQKTEDPTREPEVIVNLPVIPTPRRPVKEEAALRPLIATPRPLQKKVPQIIHSSSSSESSSEESSDDDDADESDSSEDSTEFYECENNPDGRTSTGSNDSGFDSSAPTSPAGFLQIKKGN